MTTTTQITVGSGGTYNTVANFAAALSAKNFVTEDLMWDVRVLENTTFNGVTLASLGADQSRYCRIQPVAGQGVNDINAMLNWPSTGITLDSNLRQPCTIGLGVVVEGFRIPITLTGSGDYRAWILNGVSASYPNAPCAMRRNRISAFGAGENIYITPAGNTDTRQQFTDNFVRLAAGADTTLITGGGAVLRNTFVCESAPTSNLRAAGHSNSDGDVVAFADNVVIGFGDQACTGGTTTPINNFFDAATFTSAGFTNSTVAAMCVSSSDYRTNSAGPLVGAGSASANNTLDIFGYNRGTDPDVGAAEYQVVATVPNAPTNVVATASGSTSASVAFAAPANNGGTAITGYIVTASTGQTATGAVSPVPVTGLASGTPVTFTVKAINSVGQSAASAASASVTPVAPPTGSTVPNAPSNVIATAGDGTVSVSFSVPVSNGGAAITSYMVTASTGQTATGTASPIALTMPNGVAVSFTVVATNINGNSEASSSSAMVTPTVAGDTDVQQGSIMVRTRSIGTGKTFATVNAFCAYVQGIDCVATNQLIIGEVYESQTVQQVFGAANSDASRYAWLRPASSLGFANFFSPTIAENYGTQGVELTCNNSNYNPFRISKGGRVTGFRIKIMQGTAENGGLRIQDGAGSFPPTLAGNRILNNDPNGMLLSAYALATITDNLIIRTAACGGRFFSNAWRADFDRNTLVLAAGATCSEAIYNEYGGNYRDNVFHGFAQPFTHGAGVANCYTNLAPTTAIAGLITDTVNPFFVNAATDFRPAAGLIGKGGAASISTNDNIGSNRGLSPDIGAFQLTPATPLPQGVVTAQTMDGASLVISGTTISAPTSGKITLSPGNPANGAQTVGPLDLVLASGVFSITIDDLTPGNYLITATLTNAGGTSLIAGTSSFEVAGVGNLVYDGGGVGTGGGGTPPATPDAAPTISVPASNDNILAGKTATISGPVNLQGDASGRVDVFLDPQPSGAPVALGAAPVSNGIWTKQAVIAPGLYKLRAVATANGLTATVSTGNLRILGLTGTVGIPVA